MKPLILTLLIIFCPAWINSEPIIPCPAEIRIIKMAHKYHGIRVST